MIPEILHNNLNHMAAVGAKCTINGQPADCGDTLNMFGGMMALILIPLFIIMIVMLVFWVITLIHVIQHPDVPNRTVWIILHFVGLALLAGPVYFFAVKRPYEKRTATAVPQQNNAGVAPQPSYPPQQQAQQPVSPAQPSPPQQPQSSPQPNNDHPSDGSAS